VPLANQATEEDVTVKGRW